MRQDAAPAWEYAAPPDAARMPQRPGSKVMPDSFLDPRLLELIYQSVLEPDQWSRALATITHSFRGHHAFLFTNKNSRATVPFAQTTGLTNSDLARYFSPEGIDMWAPWQAKCQSGVATAQHEMISNRDFERLDVYNEIIKPTGGFHASFIQQDDADLSFHVAVCRTKRDGQFSDEEIRKLQAISPHLSIAMQLQHRLKLAEQHSNALASALDRMPEGAIVTDARGIPLIVNARAQALLAENDGITIGTGGVRATSPALGEALPLAIARAASSRETRSQRIHLPRRKPRLPLLADILPVWRVMPGMSPKDPSAVILIKEPGSLREIDRQALGDIFRLTPRESDIAALIALGINVDTISARLGLTSGTVRYNLKNIFQKTGAHTQAALVALLQGFTLR